jgi:hypothetical protein
MRGQHPSSAEAVPRACLLRAIPWARWPGQGTGGEYVLLPSIARSRARGSPRRRLGGMSAADARARRPSRRAPSDVRAAGSVRSLPRCGAQGSRSYEGPILVRSCRPVWQQCWKGGSSHRGRARRLEFSSKHRSTLLLVANPRSALPADPSSARSIAPRRNGIGCGAIQHARLDRSSLAPNLDLGIKSGCRRTGAIWDSLTNALG